MTEQIIRKGDAYEVVAIEAVYQVWPADSREGMPLAQFKADDAGKLGAVEYFQQLETEAKSAAPNILPASSAPPVDSELDEVQPLF
jgi:hypothetical protein